MLPDRVRFAVIGLGDIAQRAVLPAFAHAPNAELTALVSTSPDKLTRLGERYGVRLLFRAEEVDDLFATGAVDAVYIATPNHLHRPYTERAAAAGLHVLVEKPMADSSEDCEVMVDACADAGVKLMVAYRLHFNEANMAAVRLAQSGALGSIRLFESLFTMSVPSGNIRLQRALGGGTLFDIGIYCINAARYLFQAEPTEVIAMSASGSDPRFMEVDEMTGAVLRFPEQRLATFATSFNSPSQSRFDVLGTEGWLRLEQAYEYSEPMRMIVEAPSRTEERSFARSDQFSPELIYFANCILRDERPEPDGDEGLTDVRIIERLYDSAQTGQAVRVDLPSPRARPHLGQALYVPPIEPPPLL